MFKKISYTLSRLRGLSDQDSSGSVNEEQLDEIAELLAKILPIYLKEQHARKYFQYWEKHGFHLTPVHFYQPIPDTGSLADDLWTTRSALVGIDMNEPMQVDLLKRAFPVFQNEYNRIPIDETEDPFEPCLNNPMFNGTDALVYYCMVRHFKPAKVIEVGSGYSSRISAKAALQNAGTQLTCIEPYPNTSLMSRFPGLTSLIPTRVQEVGFELFEQLQANDILFIDSSHVVKCGSDVNYLFLEVFPRLNPGVIVHVHDIFLPSELPKEWIKDLHLFWNEQYLLQAFLIYNSEFEVVYSNPYITWTHLEDMKTTFPITPWWGGTSFWMRRKLSV